MYSFTIFAFVAILDSPDEQEQPENVWVHVGLIGRGWPFGRPDSLGQTPPKHAVEPHDCPSRPQAPYLRENGWKWRVKGMK